MSAGGLGNVHCGKRNGDACRLSIYVNLYLNDTKTKAGPRTGLDAALKRTEHKQHNNNYAIEPNKEPSNNNMHTSDINTKSNHQYMCSFRHSTNNREKLKSCCNAIKSVFSPFWSSFLPFHLSVILSSPFKSGPVINT